MALLSVSQASASTITYNVDILGLEVPTVSIQGTLTTDGTFGSLAASNIVDWNLTIFRGSGTATVLQGPGGSNNSSVTTLTGPDLQASLTSLQFIFSDATTASNFEINSGNVNTGWFDLYDANLAFAPFGEIYVVNNNSGAGEQPITNLIGTAEVSTTPLPAALPLFVTGLGAMGLLGWRRKRKAAVLAA
jgi:hypothetical protein